MTTIVGVVTEKGVTIAADCAGTNGNFQDVRADRKVFRRGEFIVGFTTSFRMGQIILHHVPEVVWTPGFYEGVDNCIHQRLIPATRAALIEHGWMWEDKKREAGGQFLLAHGRRLFTVDTDFQVGESQRDFAAIGSGAQYALGALASGRDAANAVRIASLFDPNTNSSTVYVEKTNE